MIQSSVNTQYCGKYFDDLNETTWELPDLLLENARLRVTNARFHELKPENN